MCIAGTHNRSGADGMGIPVVGRLAGAAAFRRIDDFNNPIVFGAGARVCFRQAGWSTTGN